MKEYSESSDEELLKEYHLEKNPYLLNLLFKRHADVGFRTAMRYMRNQPDAEDVLQLAFIHFLQNLHLTREGSTNVKAWLMKVIVNISIDKLREEKRRAKRQESVASARFLENQNKMDATQMTDDKEELKKKIKQTVDTLPEKYRSPIWLILYEGFSYPEAATVLALPEKTVRTQVARGLERLRELMGTFGSILSVSLIVGLIAESKLEAAPATVNEIIDSPKLYQKIDSNSQRVSIYSAKPAVSFVTKIIFISLAVIASSAGLFYGNNSVKPTVIVSANSHQPINLIFNFNNSKEKMPFVYSGSYQIIESGGLEKSGCLELSSFFCMKIPVEIDQMPLKVSYRYNSRFSYPNEPANFDFSWGSWDKLNIFFMSPMIVSYFNQANKYIHIDY
jgi:RNA polymerase sigma-70 factor (ECF subfamily)